MMNTMNSYEMGIMNNGSAWQKGYIAERHDCMNLLTVDELKEIVETVGEQNFYAQMSDDYSVTRKEIAQNNRVANAAQNELNNR